MQVTEKTYVVYRHIFPNGKSYIGITCFKPYHRRWTSGNRYRKQPKMNHAIEKYGWENVRHEILFCELSLSDANRLEQEMIMKYDSISNGYNISIGGGGNHGHKCSNETKRKMSLAHKGRPNPWSARNLSEYVKRNGAWNRGKKLSPDHYEKLKKHWANISKPITAYDPITHEPILHFDSCEDAAKAVCVPATNIARCARGGRKTSAGYIWRYDNASI